MNPELAASFIFALGGVLLAVCGIVAVRALRQPVADRARLDALDARCDSLARLLETESKAVRALVAEANAAAVDARRYAAARSRKKDRADAEEEPAAVDGVRSAAPRAQIVFRPGCDQYGNPPIIGSQDGLSTEPTAAAKLAARGLRIVDGAVEAVA
jgi:hypothetical protein